MKHRRAVKTLRYYAFSFAFLGTAMWLSDYRYDWALILAGTLYGSLATLILQEDTE